MGMLEDAQRAANQARIEDHQRETAEKTRRSIVESIINDLVLEFVAAARQLGAKPARRAHSKRRAQAYWQVYLDGQATVWIRSDGWWDFQGRDEKVSSRDWNDGRFLDPSRADLWRRNFEAALAHRAQGHGERHGG